VLIVWTGMPVRVRALRPELLREPLVLIARAGVHAEDGVAKRAAVMIDRDHRLAPADRSRSPAAARRVPGTASFRASRKIPRARRPAQPSSAGASGWRTPRCLTRIRPSSSKRMALQPVVPVSKPISDMRSFVYH
jgi:hypothetical protein